MKPFVHLHLHTCFSLLDGACKLKDLVARAKELEMPALAMTDHGVMYGIVDFYKAAWKAGIKPILGCEAYITTGGREMRGEEARQHKMHHIVLLAKDDEGYQNLSHLISLGHMEGFYYKPRIDKEILAKYGKGLIGLSACLKGEVASYLMDDDVDGAVKAANEYAEILGKENFYLEVMDHGMAEQRKINMLMPQVAKRTGLKIVATNDVHYLKQEHAKAHEVLLCMQTQTVMSNPKRMKYASDQFFLKSREEMESLFRDMPEALDITSEIADRCNVELKFAEKAEDLHFPVYDTPNNMTQKEYLRYVSHEGIRKLYGVENPDNPKDDREKEVMARFAHEFGVIVKTGFINYFLVVWDFMHYARDEKIPVGPGRGSGGGSLVAYVLGITSIDPLHYSLIFERFLNPDRVSPPDFDIDFCQSRRGEVIEYVKKKYGSENVAQIITFGSLGAKLVIRDIGRALEIPISSCTRIAKMIPEEPGTTLEKAIKLSPDFAKAVKSDPECKRIMEYATVLEGLYRNPGTHAAGVVIGEKPLIEIVPLCKDKNGEPVTQYAKYPVEEIGLLKMDFLGLKTLTVLQEAVDTIKKDKNIDIDLEQLPLDDKITYDLLSKGDTVGVFQLESGGMRDLIRSISMDRIEDLIAMIALYRPGPMNMLPDYVSRKMGKTEVVYDHPLLAPILEETYGVMVYQEQVQKAANVLAGYSLGEADLLRRAMGKKIPEVMMEHRVKFVTGCKELNNINESLAGSIFDNMEKFAGYGFNKAHSAGYGIISYQTAYLKANHPVEFMSAIISCEMGNFEKLPIFLGEAENMGIKILPPDVNFSSPRFAPEDGNIRFGMAGIKNVGEGAAAAITAEREKNGPFESLVDFCARIPSQEINKKTTESLARCGGFDTIDPNRAKQFNGIDFAMRRAADTAKDKVSGQGSLFDLIDDSATSEVLDDIPEAEPWQEHECLSAERELLGIYMSGHPLTGYVEVLKRYQLNSITDIADLADKTVTRIGGLIGSFEKKVVKSSQSMMAVLQLEGLDASIETVVFPTTFEEYAPVIQKDATVFISGEISCKDGKQPSLIANEIYTLDAAPKLFTEHVSIHMDSRLIEKDDNIEFLKNTLRLHPGQTKVYICIIFPTGEKVFTEPEPAYDVAPSAGLIRSIEERFGEGTVFVKVKKDAYLKDHTPKWGKKKGNWNN